MRLLNDDEIWDCDLPCIEGDCPFGIGHEPARWDDAECIRCGHRTIAKAQQELTNKEWIEWVEKNMWKQGSMERWQARLKEIEL